MKKIITVILAILGIYIWIALTTFQYKHPYAGNGALLKYFKEIVLFEELEQFKEK